eukprot:m.249251 g.249251  ORF g.249251 m.249251 type:complete len:69 (-) comp19516_c1_seq9:472-678(-)
MQEIEEMHGMKSKDAQNMQQPAVVSTVAVEAYPPASSLFALKPLSSGNHTGPASRNMPFDIHTFGRCN